MILYAILLSLALSGLLYFINNSKKGKATMSKPKLTQFVNSSLPVEQLWNLILGFAKKMNLQVDDLNRKAGIIVLNEKSSMGKPGFIYPVYFSRQADSTSRIEIGISPKGLQLVGLQNALQNVATEIQYAISHSQSTVPIPIADEHSIINSNMSSYHDFQPWNNTSKQNSERPLLITIICIIGFVGSIFILPNALMLMQHYPIIGVPLFISSTIGLACMIGLWKMKRWAGIVYILLAVLVQFVLILTGKWNFISFIIPALVSAGIAFHLKEME